ncbi:hypothetical protein PN462_19255 [Spirulina sp. CS-785/01]|uniref:hypothetical protein n=1 Tax=Spirulina sp. CS-785/01 TaxID=3021716 RepID=UPI00232D158C|nr:hypothetical protein [Spirulina sp. CS-785/01]MDB9315261.1 hypothetical protein [Spirulina sp. CS-785/01]
MCCFKGNLSSKVNTLQKRVQKTEFISQLDNDNQVDILNKLDSQLWLYLGTLEKLGNKNQVSRENLVKTIEALRSIKNEVEKELEPRKARKYKVFYQFQNTVQKALSFVPSIQSQQDFQKIEGIFDTLVQSARNAKPSADFVERLTYDLSKLRQSSKITPSRLTLIYKVEALLSIIAQQEVSKLDEYQLNSFIHNKNFKEFKDLKTQILLLSRQFKKIIQEKQALEQYIKELEKLKNTAKGYEERIANLQEEAKQYKNIIRNQQNEISILSNQLQELEGELDQWQCQYYEWLEKKKGLDREIEEKQAEINNLQREIDKFSQIRHLNGDYIGNLSEVNSKYHFYRGCSYWKALVADYVLKLDTSRNIENSNTPAIFEEQGMEPCQYCQNPKRNSHIGT